LRFNLRQRTERCAHLISEVMVVTLRSARRNARWNRRRGSSQLHGEAELFVGRKLGRESVNRFSEIEALLPDDEVSVRSKFTAHDEILSN
jgi:hypothetical protein